MVVQTIRAGVSRPIERAERLLTYLDRALTHRLPTPDPVWALRIYNETEDGVHYALQPADDISNQGDACTDDVSRAIGLACEIYRATHDPQAADLARRWSTFLDHVEIRGQPGVYAPFVFADGRLNIGGYNSRPPSKWAQGNVARAYAHLWSALGDHRFEQSFWRVRRKSTPDLKAVANRAEGDLTAFEASRASGRTQAMQILERRIRHDVERIVANRERAGYFADFRHGAEPPHLRGTVQLWGYHQLMVVARAARVLDQPRWITPCERTVRTLLDPILERCFPVVPYAWPVDRKGVPRAFPDEPGRHHATTYHISSLVAGLTELYLTTNDRSYVERADRLGAWLLGDNPTGEPLYHRVHGGCFDGLHEDAVNLNMGAESSIEAARAELCLHRCHARDRIGEAVS